LIPTTFGQCMTAVYLLFTHLIRINTEDAVVEGKTNRGNHNNLIKNNKCIRPTRATDLWPKQSSGAGQKAPPRAEQPRFRCQAAVKNVYRTFDDKMFF